MQVVTSSTVFARGVAYSFAPVCPEASGGFAPGGRRRRLAGLDRVDPLRLARGRLVDVVAFLGVILEIRTAWSFEGV